VHARSNPALRIVPQEFAIRRKRRRTNIALERLAGAALETLLNAIEANDPITGMHVRRVAAGALVIADAAGMDEHECKSVERVALFHDIGKIHEALFDIVHEGTRLTPAERRAIDTHPERGAEVLAPLEAFYPELPLGVLAHHERWDGRGYPHRLRAEKIPIQARIVAVADTFDAVAQSRRYRRGTGADAAFDVIAQGRGTQFDPAIVDLVLLPPIQALLAQSGETVQVRKQRYSARRKTNRGDAPDVSFRWRSESLGTRRVQASSNVD